MAAANEGQNPPLVETEGRNPYASASQWRHQESSAFLRHAGHAPREPVNGVGDTGDLADFLNKSRVEPEGEIPGGNSKPLVVAANEANGDAAIKQPDFIADGKEIVCGPLLNYRRMDQGRWYGSVLIVVNGGGAQPLHTPYMTLRQGPQLGASGEANGASREEARIDPECLYSDPRNTFWAFDINVPMHEVETSYEYTIPDMRFSGEHKPKINRFYVPAVNESMRMMFHSCNGFSVGIDEDAWSGSALWNDVVRKHAERPIHVMLGGGDQIYNDGIRVDGPLREWTAISNPKKRRDFPFPEKLRHECDDYYLKNYIQWYNKDPFASVNGQIPQLNIWDDHDIIDGFGSYTDHFMRCDVFRGIGGTAHKYYMLFQHHLPPPPSTYTSDHSAQHVSTQGANPNQLIDTYVAPTKTDPSYIVGTKPGPYVAEHSYNIYTRLGARIALVGIDARVERTRHQVNYPETYDLIFNRLKDELAAAASSGQPIKHLILLLGIPIAYPRLTWLENIFRSPLMGPVKLLNRRFGVGGGLFNHFDGSIDLLDDLDDHYTARTHKAERLNMMLELQKIAAQFSVRVTILGGDVHLAALGRFYSNPNLKIPVEEDHRYMVNVVSSAIVNKPPPQAVANLLARRNKIHHLNVKTNETLLDLFNKDPGESTKTAAHNHCTMPSRNFAFLTENSPNNPPLALNGQTEESEPQSFVGKDGHTILHKGEVGCGTSHRASSMASHGKAHDGGLDICINVEIDQHNPQGVTQGYGLTVPMLHYQDTVLPGNTPAPSVPSVTGEEP